jgi:membrane-associated protein
VLTTPLIAATTLAMIGPDWLDADKLIASFGDYALIGICVVVFIETGLLFPFLPGDSLLFTGGLLVAQGTLKTPVWLLCLMIWLAAVAGDQSAYWIGRTIGPRLFKNPDARILKPQYIKDAEAYFEKYGALTIIIARFMPFIRTFSGVSAGMAKMRYPKFVAFDIVGGFVWGVGVTVLGYFLGTIPFVKDNIDFILVGIILVSLSPIIIATGTKWLQSRKNQTAPAPEGATGPTENVAVDSSVLDVPVERAAVEQVTMEQVTMEQVTVERVAVERGAVERGAVERAASEAPSRNEAPNRDEAP